LGEGEPAGVFEFAQEEAGAHFGVVASAVMTDVGDFKLGAQHVEAVVAEVVEAAGGTQGAVVGDVGLGEAVEIERVANAIHVERGVVRHQRGVQLQVLADFVPHLGELGCVGCVLGPDAMHPAVPVAVAVALGADEPRACINHLAASDHADARLADASLLASRGFKVNGNEIYIKHINVTGFRENDW